MLYFLVFPVFLLLLIMEVQIIFNEFWGYFQVLNNIYSYNK